MEKTRGKEPRRRIPAGKVEEVQLRLKRSRSRRDLSLAEAARKIERERISLGQLRRRMSGYKWEERRKYGTTATQVGRYEGSYERSAAPYIEYVEAAAVAYDVPTEYLLAEPAEEIDFDPDGFGEFHRKSWESIWAGIEEGRPEAEREKDELLRRIDRMISLSLRLPRGSTVDIDPTFRIAELAYRAFAGRGCSVQRILGLSAELGSLVVSPHTLPPEGFLSPWEMDEHRYERFWMLQMAALEALIRPQSDGAHADASRMENRARWHEQTSNLFEMHARGQRPVAAPADKLEEAINAFSQTPLLEKAPVDGADATSNDNLEVSNGAKD
jgi:transcriptional regulator with XRE-family HTH domain